MIKGIIFDYGGTIDTGGDHWSEVIYRAYQRAGVAIEKGAFREAYVYAERELARTLHILPHHTFGDLLKIKIEIELQHLCEEGLFAPSEVTTKSEEIAGYCEEDAKESIERAKETLSKLKEQYPMVLVSNFYGNIRTVLKTYGLSDYFSKVIESAVVGIRKPDPKIFRLGCQALGLKPEETIVVGDSYRKDILPALKTGCKAVWLKGIQWSEEEASVDYQPTIQDLSELLEIIKTQ
ncbi:MAG: HAD family hydrolase [Clostridium sp.]|nr:HAD family hydrolase [Prevotella sp.]MCM1428413.1 HAD family hydrolase [Clostridium sp.]MCM1476256.1 HAD family hydrolase [Muribaculaceae bacterium]